MVLLYSPVCDLPRKEGSEKNSQQENGGCEWLLPLLTAYQVKLEYLCIDIHAIPVKLNQLKYFAHLFILYKFHVS